MDFDVPNRSKGAFGRTMAVVILSADWNGKVLRTFDEYDWFRGGKYSLARDYLFARILAPWHFFGGPPKQAPNHA